MLPARPAPTITATSRLTTAAIATTRRDRLGKCRTTCHLHPVISTRCRRHVITTRRHLLVITTHRHRVIMTCRRPHGIMTCQRRRGRRKELWFSVNIGGRV